MTVSEAAAYALVPEMTVHTWIAEGRYPARSVADAMTLVGFEYAYPRSLTPAERRAWFERIDTIDDSDSLFDMAVDALVQVLRHDDPTVVGGETPRRRR